jgi:hypothetical protein
MDKQKILDKLRSGQAIFTEQLPHSSQREVIGIEHELGVAEDDHLEKDFISIKSPNFDNWFSNGGRIYIDCGHVETCTPETSNPLEAVLYSRAMWRAAESLALSERLYANNRGKTSSVEIPLGTSFGCHENIATSAKPEEWKKIVPFLVARVLINGSGFYNQEGCFDISQRASFIETVWNSGTCSKRAIVGSRINEQDIDDIIARKKRMHLILGDSNMCEVQAFISIGMTSLVVRMLEEEKLPHIEYDETIYNDLHVLSSSASAWITQEKIGGIRYWRMSSIKNRTALSILWEYLTAAKKFYGGEDEITDLLLILMEDTLDKLDSDPLGLFGRLDWVTKLVLFRAHTEKNEGVIDKKAIYHLDLAYHLLGKQGMHAVLQKTNAVEKLFSPSCIERAMSVPPRFTRAFFRGKIVSLCMKKTEPHVHLKGCGWKYCLIGVGIGEGVIIQESYQIPDAARSYVGDYLKLVRSLRNK